jgi:hypothetical protein
MNNKKRYWCHAVVNDKLVEYKVYAVSDKQARFLFCQQYGYKHRDFKIIYREEIVPQQLCMF